MGIATKIDDLELAALISSKICHDVIGPVGAISLGLEVLDDQSDERSREHSLEAIRAYTRQASAKLQFARFAFGASGSAGATIDLRNAEQISRGFIATGKHTLTWTAPAGVLSKDRAKLLLNMIASAQGALPRGGEIAVSVKGSLERPRFEVRCKGPSARPPQALVDTIAAGEAAMLDALTIQAYYTCRLARTGDMRLQAGLDGPDVLILAEARN